jgi:hypothetical protein
MIGKASLEDFLSLKRKVVPPFYQINMGSFSSLVKSVEGYLHAVVLVENQTGFRWIYGIKTKDESIKVVKQWYSNIADLRTRHKLVVVMRDNAAKIISGNPRILRIRGSTKSFQHAQGAMAKWGS